MNTLYFGNNGTFDVRAMLTFGVSAKENENAIGYFGTGFKYAVAIILRLGGKISIHTGGQNYAFTKSRETIRGQEFDLVKMNGTDAGFTTRLGINWQPWQAFRELYCNCKDEFGEVSAVMPNTDTVVAVDCPEIFSAYQDKQRYFLDGTPDVESDHADIHDKHSHYIFYRGVAVMDTGNPALFTYNIKGQLDLTEDRTVRHDFIARFRIQKALQAITDPVMMRRILTADSNTFEGGVTFDPDYETSDCFVEIASNLIKTGSNINESARRLLAKLDDKKGAWPEANLTRVQQTMLDKAISFLCKIDISATQYPVKVVESMGEGIMGRAIDGTIYLSLLPFNMGTKQVASTLMEEWVHTRLGVKDFDYGMQNWLFDKILSMGEELAGSPL